MPLILPLLTDLGATPHYRFQCELEAPISSQASSQTYTFEFIWNDRDQSWYCQIGDSQENLLAGSVRVVLGKSLFGRYVNPNLPPGQFTVIDTTGQDQDAGLADLGSRVQVWYVTAAEVVALG